MYKLCQETRLNATAILEQLDNAADEYVFPMLDNGYVYPADVRLTVYRNSQDWLMIIEVLGAYTPRTCGCDSFQNCLHLFGSTLHRKPGPANVDFLHPIDSLQADPLFDDEYEWYLRAEARSLGIRGSVIVFDPSPEALALKGIELLNPPKVDPPAILRSLLPEHREELLASDDELAARNPKQLACWFRLNEWYHPDLADDELPSESETFQMISRVIETGDTSLYTPTHPPNTHWKNWPEGGTL